MSALPSPSGPLSRVADGRAVREAEDAPDRGAARRDRMPRWMAQQLAWPLLAFAVANIWLIGFHGDRWIADRVFAWEGGRWALQDAYWTKHVIHAGGKRLVSIAGALLALACIVVQLRPGLRAWRRPLLTLLLSVLASTLLVTMLKPMTHMDCPWDLSAYGGHRDYFALFSARPAGLRASGCFPAGHSSAGYAWVALYFFFLTVRPAWRWYGLGIGLAAGLVFGVSQQLRGAHFLSHDVWTLTICWVIAVLFHRFGVYAALAKALHGVIRRLRARAPHAA